MSSSSEASSESKERTGFEFNGTIYATYSEMVSAKRERNRNFLQRRLSEIAETVGSMKTRDSSKDGTASKKRKNMAASHSKSPVRRNPRRSASSTASYKQTPDGDSSISSKASYSYSGKSACSDDDNIEDTDDVQKEKQKKQAYTAAVDKKKRVPNPKPRRTKTIAALNRKPRQSKTVASIVAYKPKVLGYESSISSVSSSSHFSQIVQKRKLEIQARNAAKRKKSAPKPKNLKSALRTGNKRKKLRAEGATGVPTVKVTRPRMERVRKPRRMKDPSAAKPEYLPLKVPNLYSRVRGPCANDLLPLQDIKEMSAILEHIVLGGFRVKRREQAWRDFCAKGSSGINDNNVPRAAGLPNAAEKKAMYAVDRTLYAGVISNGSKQTESSTTQDETESDDDLIPREYLLHGNNQSKPSNSSKEMDRQWIEEFGDGLDPTMFVDEYLSSNDGEAGKYTSLLLQKCWERAVGAVSGTINANLGKQQPTSSDGTDTNSHLLEKLCTKKKEANQSLHDQRLAVSSDLHREAMSIVYGLIDLIFSDESDLAKKFSEDEQESERRANWRDVVKVLNESVQSAKTCANSDSGKQPANSLASLLDEATVKSITMRLIDRYETT